MWRRSRSRSSAPASAACRRRSRSSRRGHPVTLVERRTGLHRGRRRAPALAQREPHPHRPRSRRRRCAASRPSPTGSSIRAMRVRRPDRRDRARPLHARALRRALLARAQGRSAADPPRCRALASRTSASLMGRAVETVGSRRRGGAASLVCTPAAARAAAFDAVVGADGLWSKVRQAARRRRRPRPIAASSPGARTIARRRRARALSRQRDRPVARARRPSRPLPDRRRTPPQPRRHRAPARCPSRAGRRRATAPTPARPLRGAAPTCATSSRLRTTGSSGPSSTARPRRSRRAAIALLGDAAHPVLPFLAQGAALAIEDAAALARLLTRRSDVPGSCGLTRPERMTRVRTRPGPRPPQRRSITCGGLPAFARNLVDAPSRPRGHGAALRLALRLRRRTVPCAAKGGPLTVLAVRGRGETGRRKRLKISRAMPMRVRSPPSAPMLAARWSRNRRLSPAVHVQCGAPA